MHIVVNSHQLTIKRKVGVHRALHDQFIATRNGKPPWLTLSFVRTLCEIDHHDVVSSGIIADKIPGKLPRAWTKQALITLEKATEAYMVEVFTKSHRYKQRLISSKFSTCLLLWQGKEVGYSWNSPTCASP